MHRVAYCEVPKLAGVYTFAVNLHGHLARHGYDLRLVGVGPQAASDYTRCLSVVPATVLAPDATDVETQRDALCRWLDDERIDILMVSGSETEHRLIPTLPSRVRVVSIINNATRGQYRVGTAHHERMHRVVCVSPRLARDIRRWRVPAEKIVLIPYGIDAAAAARARAARPDATPEDAARENAALESTARQDPRSNGPLRIVLLGRLCDSAKGIYLIPRILKPLERAGVALHLTVIGDGPDGAEFAARMARAGLAHRWTHVGFTRYDAILPLLARQDVLLLPSRHEGLSLTLIEGMAAGCVPVASRLAGVTDYVIHGPREGVLCRVGRVGEFTRALAALAADRTRLRAMSSAAAARIAAAFTSERMASAYASLFDAILDEPSIATAPRTRAAAPRSGWSGMLRRRMPAPLKNAVRTACERVGVTV